MNKSNAVRCSHCNLVNFSTAPFCKRCRTPFQNPANVVQGNTLNININIPASIDNINVNAPLNEMRQFHPNPPEFTQPQPQYFHDTESYQPQNQMGFEQWQQMNAPMSAPVFPHPRQMTANGVFRHGKEIVVHRNATLPERCVKCNEYISGYDAGGFARQKFRWHNPLVYIALISPLIYLILAAVLSQRVTIDIPLCHQHLEDRKKTGNHLLVSGVLAMIAIFFFGSIGYVGFAFLLFFIAIFGLPIAYEYIYKPLQVSKIENDYIYLKGVNEEYIRNLPYC